MSVTELQLQAQGGRAGPIRAIEAHGRWRLAWRRLVRDRAAVASAVVILVMAALAVAAPWFAALTGHGAAQQFPNTGLSATGVPAGPGAAFWLGADELGRDLFVRLLYGARVSLFVGVVATAIGTVLGVSAGLAAGYFGGWLDSVLSRLVDAVLAFPYIVLALALAAVLGPSLPVVIGVISFFAWSGIARVVRGQTISLREREYVEAARSLALLLTTLAFNLLGDGIRDALDPSAERLLDGGRSGRRGFGSRFRRFVTVLSRPPRLQARAVAANSTTKNTIAADSPGSQASTGAGAGARPEPAPRIRAPAGITISDNTTPPDHPGRRPEPGAVTRREPWLPRLGRALRGGRTVVVFGIRRSLTGIVVLWVVSLGTFLLFFTRPAISVARSMAGKEPTAAQLRQITRQLGLNQPIAARYWHFLYRLLHGDLGYSYATGEPVTTILAQDLPRTASVVAGGLVLWLLAGISVGVLSATRARSVFDRLATVGVLAGLSLPTFVLGQLLLFGVFLQLNKHGFTWIQDGYVSPAQSLTGWIGHMVLPWITLATVSAAVYSRLCRSSLLETLGQDYIRTARAKGLAERRVVLRHALRSALTPVVSQLGIDVGTLLGGVVVVETVFGLGGIGQDSVQAIDQGNLPVIIGFVLAAAVFVVVANIVVDLAYTLLDPRVRLR